MTIEERKALEWKLTQARQHIFEKPEMKQEIIRIKELLKGEWKEEARERQAMRDVNYFM